MPMDLSCLTSESLQFFYKEGFDGNGMKCYNLSSI